MTELAAVSAFLMTLVTIGAGLLAVTLLAAGGQWLRARRGDMPLRGRPAIPAYRRHAVLGH